MTPKDDHSTYVIDCIEAETRYIISCGEIVAHIKSEDISWLRCFSPNLEAFGTYIDKEEKPSIFN